MATLTDDEITLVRMRIGDTSGDTAQNYDLSNAIIQSQWDRADGHGSEENEYRAYYYMLQLRYGMWINSINTQTESGASLSHQQKKQNIQDLMNMYRDMAGIGMFTIPSTSGVLDFDFTENDPLE